MSAVDWSRYQQCPVCAAELGHACRSLTGFAAAGGFLSTETKRAHGGRKLRAGAADVQP